MSIGSYKGTESDLNGKKLHTIHMEQRNKAVITGVDDIRCYHENEIVLKLYDVQLFLTGTNLRLGRLMLEEGRVDVEGHIDSILYEAPRGSFESMFPWKRKEK